MVEEYRTQDVSSLKERLDKFESSLDEEKRFRIDVSTALASQSSKIDGVWRFMQDIEESLKSVQSRQNEKLPILGILSAVTGIVSLVGLVIVGYTNLVMSTHDNLAMERHRQQAETLSVLEGVVDTLEERQRILENTTAINRTTLEYLREDRSE